MDHTNPLPREKRSSVIVRAIVTTLDGRSSERRVRNLSARGACIEHDGDLKPDTILTLRMGTIEDLRAVVHWVSDRLAGLQFAEPVDLEEARKPRGVAVSAKAGWMADINDAYRR